MKKLLSFIATATILVGSMATSVHADELADLLNGAGSSTGTTTSAPAGSGTVTAQTGSVSPTSGTMTGVPSSGVTGMPTGAPTLGMPTGVNGASSVQTITVTNGSWKQTINDSNIIVFFKVKKDTPVSSLFTVAYINDLQMTTTVKAADLKNFFDISTVRTDGSELTLASGELKTVKAGDELKVTLVKGTPLLNKELTFVAPSSITPDHFGILDVASGKIVTLGTYVSAAGSIAPVDMQGAVVSDTGATVANDVIPNTQTGAKENILMLMLALLVIGGLGIARNKKSA